MSKDNTIASFLFHLGFTMLNKVLGENGFFKKGYPENFVTDNSDAERNALRTVWPNSQLFLCIFHLLQQSWRWLCDTKHGIKKEDRQLLMKSAQQLVYSPSETEFQEKWTDFLQSSEARQYEQYRW